VQQITGVYPVARNATMPSSLAIDVIVSIAKRRNVMGQPRKLDFHKRLEKLALDELKQCARTYADFTLHMDHWPHPNSHSVLEAGFKLRLAAKRWRAMELETEYRKEQAARLEASSANDEVTVSGTQLLVK
jgi:hypothetical protein